MVNLAANGKPYKIQSRNYEKLFYLWFKHRDDRWRWRSLEHGGIEVSDEEPVDRGIAQPIDPLVIVIVEQGSARVLELKLFLDCRKCLRCVVDVLLLDGTGANVEDARGHRRGIGVDDTDAGQRGRLDVFCFLVGRINVSKVNVPRKLLVCHLGGHNRCLVDIWKINF